MSTSTSQELRCPRCAAAVRPGSDWCTLCYTDLRPRAAEPEPTPAATAEPAAEAAAESVPGRGSGKHARRSEPRDPADGPLASVDVDSMLAQLAATEGGASMGRFSQHLDSKPKQAAVMVGGGVAVTLLFLLVLVVLGALF